MKPVPQARETFDGPMPLPGGGPVPNCLDPRPARGRPGPGR